MLKVIIMLEFGSPLGWEQKFIDQFNRDAGDDWFLMIFTPNNFVSSKRAAVVPMDIEEFNQLLEKKCGVNPHNFIKENGVPDKLISDYYPAFGHIFEDYIGAFDFWGHANWDIVWGNLDHFLNDPYLEDADIFADEPNTINGVFTIYRNNPLVNTLYQRHPQWKKVFTDHQLFVFDEFEQYMPTVAREAHELGLIRFKTSNPHFHSYEKDVKLEWKDGLLANGKEILLYHFSRSKQYPDVPRT